MEHIAMQIADSGLLSGGTPTTRKQVDRVDDSSRPDEEHAGSQPRSGQAGQDLPRVFALAATGGERVLAYATFADEFSALLLAVPTPHLLAVKRTVNIVLSAAALIALLPLFAVLGALIQGEQLRARLLRAAPRRPSGAYLQDVQVPLYGGQRRGAQNAARGPERIERAGIQDETRSADHGDWQVHP
jgi:hypothetical protein